MYTLDSFIQNKAECQGDLFTDILNHVRGGSCTSYSYIVVRQMLTMADKRGEGDMATNNIADKITK